MAHAQPRCSAGLVQRATRRVTRRTLAQAHRTRGVACRASLSVAIVGAGVGGLSLALALEKEVPTARVTLLEQTPAARYGQPAGAAFNLNGAVAVLTDLSLGEQLAAISNPMSRVLSRTVGGLGLLDIDVEALVRSQPATAAGLVRFGRSCAVTVLRSDVIAVLRGALRTTNLVLGARVSGVSPTGALVFSTPSTKEVSERFDLIVAADGIRSPVRGALLGSDPPPPPAYTGIRIAFARVPRSAFSRSSPSCEVHQWFGPNGYCLQYTAGGSDSAAQNSGAHCIALCWRDAASPAAGDNAAWAAGGRDVAAAMSARLRAGGFPQELQSHLAAASAASSGGAVFEIGVFDTAPLPQDRWWSGPDAKDNPTPNSNPTQKARGFPHIVLLGDAAHAMPPFLGQGANQAVQDAACLASKLRNMQNSSTSSDMGAALRAYAAVRCPPTAALQRSSRFVGALDTLQSPLHVLRDVSLWGAGVSGIAAQIFLAGAMPRV